MNTHLEERPHSVQWADKLGVTKNKDGWTWNGRFKIVDFGMPEFEIPPHLVDIVNPLTFLQHEPQRLPLFIGTQFGIGPRIPLFDKNLWQICATQEEKSLYTSFRDMNEKSTLERFPKIVRKYLHGEPWMVAMLGKSVLSGTVGGVTIKYMRREYPFGQDLKYEEVLRFENWDR